MKEFKFNPFGGVFSTAVLASYFIFYITIIPPVWLCFSYILYATLVLLSTFGIVKGDVTLRYWMK